MDRRALSEAAAELAAVLPDLDVRTAVGERERYARDKSSFELVPAAVAVVREEHEVGELVREAARRSLPVTARAGGSSVAGQCLGEGLVIDLSRLNGIRPGDEASDATAGTAGAGAEMAGATPGKAGTSPEAAGAYRGAAGTAAGTVVCGPGALLDDVNRTLAPYGQQIGPDTTSSMLARAGGLVGTNACGSRSLRYGRFGDHLVAAEAVMAGGETLKIEPGYVPEALAGSLGALRKRVAPVVDQWPDQQRAFGGYRLDAFARSGDVLSLLPGSEGTLCIATSVALVTVPLPESRVLDAVGYPSVRDALEATTGFVERGAVAVELIDSHQLAAARKEGLAVPGSTDDRALLLVEYLDTEPPAISGERLEGKDAERAWWLRQAALWLATRGGQVPVAVFEDPAVAMEQLAPFHDGVERLLARFGFDAIIYGHAGAGCLHLRPLTDAGDPQLARRLGECLAAVADLVAEFDGALTGEHGWGLARSHLTAAAVGHDLYECFREIKHAFDPQAVLNPGKIVGGRDPFPWFAPRRPS